MFLVGKSSIQTTNYDILSVKEDAKYEKIRPMYKSIVLSSHPDKLHSIRRHGMTPMKPKSCEILGDSKTWALYDHEMRDSEQYIDTTKDINLE
ncbi:hypothetical protein AQUCO_00300483v1 [Aquilegia coerulea]|uniref:J domain-containing protein n=1 Tax=Aquilegia coerulea TaxID=218851 RepID=A0A2G5EZ39_AQUCA|nr:hypothetical protein AQUCO_00300483v1 [Aquilegia coerulea]